MFTVSRLARLVNFVIFFVFAILSFLQSENNQQRKESKTQFDLRTSDVQNYDFLHFQMVAIKNNDSN